MITQDTLDGQSDIKRYHKLHLMGNQGKKITQDAPDGQTGQKR